MAHANDQSLKDSITNPWSSFAQTYAVPVCLIQALYLTWVVLGPSKFRQKAYTSSGFRSLWVLWNFALALYSFVVVYKLTPTFVEELSQVNGFHNLICKPSWTSNSVVVFWNATFVLSKVIELGDTIFLVLSGKQVPFLHWFHHVSVLTQCWLSMMQSSSTGILFAYVNAVVHTLMQTQQAVVVGRLARIPEWMTQTLTTFQILQMVLGVSTLMQVAWLKSDCSHSTCETPLSNVILGLQMYSVYLYLFVEYAIKRQILVHDELKLKSMQTKMDASLQPMQTVYKPTSPWTQKAPNFWTNFLRPLQINQALVEADDSWFGTLLWARLAPFNIAIFSIATSIYFFARASKAEGSTQAAFHDAAQVTLATGIFLLAAQIVLVARQRWQIGH